MEKRVKVGRSEGEEERGRGKGNEVSMAKVTG